MKLTKSANALLTLLLIAFAGIAYSQPRSVTSDGFSDEASVWLKSHPVVAKCANAMSTTSQKEKQKRGMDAVTTYAEYGEFIGKCAKTSSNVAVASKKMQGDQLDKNPGAKPNGSAEAKNKKTGKAWQDNNGFMHYPDGSASNGPVD